jgi:hypothetical protein
MREARSQRMQTVVHRAPAFMPLAMLIAAHHSSSGRSRKVVAQRKRSTQTSPVECASLS